MRKGLTTKEQIKDMKVELYKAEHNIKSTAQSKNKAKKVTEIIIMSVMVLFTVAFVLYATIFNGSGKPISIFSHYIYNVETASMEPTLLVGDKFISKAVEHDTHLKVGDIITFITDTDLRVTHRIVEIITNEEGETRYKTKGDNPINSIDDWELKKSQIEAVFKFRIPTLRDLL